MDLVALAFALLLQYPDARPAKARPGSTPDTLAEFSVGVLRCYHRTARPQGSEVLEKPWSGQPQEGVDQSALIRIRYLGVTGAQHAMIVALLASEKRAHTEVVDDTATIPFNRKCNLAAEAGR